MKDPFFLSLVFPAYNEGQRIARCLEGARDFLKRESRPVEIIVVDDGSRDRTVEVARGFQDELPLVIVRTPRNEGKGRTVARGVLLAQGEFVLFSDVDLSTPLADAYRLLGALEEGADVAIGSRALKDSEVLVHQKWVREHMGKTFNWIARRVAFRGISDSQCGFKAFRREAARKLFEHLRVNGFAFDAEILYLAQRWGYRIREVPVHWVNSPDTKVHLFADPWVMLFDILRIQWLHRHDGRAHPL